MNRLRRKDEATWAALAFVAIALAAVGIAAWLLADSQADQRRELRDRFADRVEVSTALIGSLLGVAYNGQREDAAERFAGPIDQDALDAAMRRGNARYMIVFDESGNVVASTTGAPADAADRRALAEKTFGEPAGYALGEMQRGDLIESAVVFPAGTSRRALVTAAPAMAFRDFLGGSLTPLPQGRSGRAFVFDREGNTVASVNTPRGLRADPLVVREALKRGQGEVTASNGEERFFAADRIPGSDWQIVSSVSQAALYDTASGASRWTPWAILGIGFVALLGVAVLVGRLLRARGRLRATNDDLEESRVHLQQRAAELERSNADLEQFAYAASHDLSEPLRTVAGFSQLLGSRYKGRLDDEADEMIGYMGDGVERMQQLIDDLLLYSRVGRTPLRDDFVDLNEVVTEARAWLGPAVVEAGAVIESSGLPVVRGEQGQLTQVFQNLLGNAIKFTAPGVVPTVRISAEPSNGEWRISVADNGIGVDPAQAGAIFKMFGRLHPTDTYPGTGIGLALVKRIVERHGGRIWIEPGADGGSVFVFTLPDRVRTAPPQPEAAAAPEAVA